ncbi:MAG: YkgJ family cysteine cluster protein [Alphaproteobacteria bacterium]|nr:YkgJ family cysteine cluster protein [Alphaproteobacteria bacterium]
MDNAERSVNCSAPDFLAAWWRGDAGPVPCGECSACCYYAGIPADKKRDRRHLPYLLTERDRDGELVLQQRADGACAHLGEHGCTVYEHRPAVCRNFDCRAFAAMGLVEHCGPNQRTPDWEFAAREGGGSWFGPAARTLGEVPLVLGAPAGQDR